MEFGEKLQKIRKEHNMTQEQLAEKLYISRTAISKWESNRGYPNLDTLKDIAKIFNITIDDLLSSDKIIDIGSRENKLNSNRIINLCLGLLDVIIFLLLFLPLYPSKIGSMIYSVSIITPNDLSNLLIIFNIIILSIISLIGILEIILFFVNNDKFQTIINTISITIHIISTLFFALSRQSYLTAISLIILIIKVILYIKKSYKINRKFL